MITNYLTEVFTQEEIDHGWVCSCGSKHVIPTKMVALAEGLVEQVGFLAKELGLFGCGFLVADQNTYSVAGERVYDSLTRAGFSIERYIFDGPSKIYPSPEFLVDLFDRVPANTEFFVAVGSGTISDLVKFVAAKMHKPYLMVPTAPSMDGYACGVSALIRRGVRTSSYGLNPPKAIIADVSVLKDAPVDMIAAGVADLLGKFSALADWELGHSITGEFFCPRAYTMMREAVTECFQVDWHRELQTEDAVRILMQGLLKSGLAMFLAGTSRPASGSEHAIGHVLEMMELQAGEPKLLHGLRIGLTTPVALELYQTFLVLSNEDLRTEPAPWNPKVVWNNASRYGEGDKRRAEFQRLKDNLRQLQQQISGWIPHPEQLVTQLASIGVPVSYQECEIPKESFKTAILQANSLKDRYTILDALVDLGLLESAVSDLL